MSNEFQLFIRPFSVDGKTLHNKMQVSSLLCEKKNAYNFNKCSTFSLITPTPCKFWGVDKTGTSIYSLQLCLLTLYECYVETLFLNKYT